MLFVALTTGQEIYRGTGWARCPFALPKRQSKLWANGIRWRRILISCRLGWISIEGRSSGKSVDSGL